MPQTTSPYAVADYLMDRLAEMGCEKIFGVPRVPKRCCRDTSPAWGCLQSTRSGRNVP